MTLSFGKYKGKTFEWIFFNAPWYARWLQDNEILRDRWDQTDVDKAYFKELYRRASALSGICPHCEADRPVARKALAIRDEMLGACTFCCCECEPIDETAIEYQRPSFFLERGPMARMHQRTLTARIKERKRHGQRHGETIDFGRAIYAASCWAVWRALAQASGRTSLIRRLVSDGSCVSTSRR